MPPRVPRLVLVLVLVVVPSLVSVAGSASEGDEPVDLGAVSVPDLFEPTLPFLDLEPEGSAVLPAGTLRVDLTFSVANSFAHSRVIEPLLNARDSRQPVTFEELRSLEDIDGSEGIFYVDGEVWQTLLSLRRGLPGGIELRLDLPWRDVTPGVLDAGIEAFHGATYFDPAGRGGVPLDAYTLYVRSDGRLEVARDQDPGPGLGDVTLGAKGRLRPFGAWSLALEGVVKLPTGSEQSLYGSGAVDLGLELHAGRSLGAWGALELSLGGRRLGASGFWKTPDQTLASLFAGWRRAFGERRAWDLFFQFTLAEVPFDTLRLKELAREAWIFDLGVRRRFSSGRFLWFAVTENQFTYQSSADVALTLGVGGVIAGRR